MSNSLRSSTKLSKQRSDSGDPVVLYDGVCNFCNGAVQFVLRHDAEGIFRFAALQGAKARELIGSQPVLVAAKGDPTSIVLIQWGHTYIKTDAVFRIARLLSGGYSWLYLLLIIPRPIRDQFYDWFAANRYKWFGRKDSCPIPSAEQRERFLD